VVQVLGSDKAVVLHGIGSVFQGFAQGNLRA
jgi:hypothetical protein